jgi:AraC-like DNA-binding protein
MESFNVINPSQVLTPYVKHYWILKISDVPVISERVVATGFMTLIFHRGQRMFSSAEDDLQPRSFVCGLSTKFTDLSSSRQIDMIVVVFRPYGIRALFDVPANEFGEKCVSISDIGDRLLSELEDRLFYQTDDKACVALIEQFLMKRLHSKVDYNYKRIVASVNEINNHSLTNIKSLANVACLSPKQFTRIFSENVGSNPKEYIRIIRFQRALFVLQNNINISMTQLAYECGYYDQPHLIREFKSFSGYTPKEYLLVCAPYSDYFS